MTSQGFPADSYGLLLPSCRYLWTRKVYFSPPQRNLPSLSCFTCPLVTGPRVHFPVLSQAAGLAWP